MIYIIIILCNVLSIPVTIYFIVLSRLCYFLVFYNHFFILMSVSKKKIYKIMYIRMYLNILCIYHIIHHACARPNRNNKGDNNNVFPTPFQQALFFPTVYPLLIYRGRHCHLHTVNRDWTLFVNRLKRIFRRVNNWILTAFCIRLS